LFNTKVLGRVCGQVGGIFIFIIEYTLRTDIEQVNENLFKLQTVAPLISLKTLGIF